MRPSRLTIAVLLAATPLAAQTTPGDDRSVATIAGSPLHDFGIKKTKVSPVLVRAAAHPYTTDGLRTCKDIGAAVLELNTALGRDVDAPTDGKKPSEATELSMDAGQDTINSLIPGRFIIRRLSGAANAQRKARAVVYAASVRRGFLKGYGDAKGCKWPAAPRVK
ncbi:hypothetical protein KZX46_17035 [Polymorphobacter sp. PAMC 29334]|uniref:hypothetical protein n=1 Tax=Polymorphobacter sp. PAMC 29334 TaxID=2862331 RepID=UPI001C773733|nr:hypothetical protein [Polymorphobacter sp. PAMC 29334]QYE34459.1 hypothetical protein KZX46_17035 [Polymorphobacter sp. PAMC 29334]